MAVTRLKRKKQKNILIAKKRKIRLKQLLKTPQLVHTKKDTF